MSAALDALVAAALLLVPPTAAATAPPASPAFDEEVEGRADPLEDALVRAGERRGTWEAALEQAGARREDLAFLVAHMPDRDLAALDPSWVLRDAELAHGAWRAAPWAELVPREVYLDAILPYAALDEPREDWRPGLRARFLDLVAGCATPGEAAQVLNREVFAALGVEYSTRRRRANQAPSESIEQGLASCTGLSILLVDACRAVGVPARLAGIGAWPHKDGNHTWVEVWDGERWRFTGAAEPDAAGLDRAWFVGDARRAVAGHPLHAVMAVTWRRTGEHFHLPWDPSARTVNAVDATARYAPAPHASDGTVAVRVRAWGGSERVEADVVLRRRERSDGASPVERGRTKGPRADMNDLLEFRVPRFADAVVEAGDGAVRAVLGAVACDVTVDLFLELGEARVVRDERNLVIDDELVRRDPATARRVAFERFVRADEAALEPLRADHAERRVRTADREAPYTLKRVGERAAGERWPLVIAMHGGGGVPPEVNDQQWRHMQVYYRDHPEAGGYLYVALRAPNDAWNGFYDDAIVPLVERLVRQLVVTEEADPTRVYAIGYSHGGYGAWVLAPKAPHLFAGVHASAAAATDGETRLENLSNLRFSFMVGELDTAYGRFERNENAAARLAELREASGGELYPFEYDLVRGNGHTGLPDRDYLPRLLERRRRSGADAPTRLAWRTTDDRVADHYWLHLPAPASGVEVDARLERSRGDGPNRVVLDVRGTDRVALLLDERQVDPTRPLEVTVNGGAPRLVALVPSAAVLLAEVERRCDPDFAGTLRVEVEVPPADGE